MSGAFSTTSTGSAIAANYGAGFTRNFDFKASRSSSTYQDNAHVRPFSMTTAFLIRY